MNKTMVAVSVAVLTLLAGCSSDNDGAKGGKPAADRDPCGVLTDDQVSEAIGHKPTKRTPVTDHGPLRACEWKTDTPDVALNVTFGSLKEAPLPPDFGEHGWEPVDGVGEKAAYSMGFGTLVVQGGGYHLRIKTLLGEAETDETSDDAKRDRSIQVGSMVAKDVLANLGAGPRDDSPPRKTGTPRSSEVPDSEEPEPTETSEPETATIPEPETSDPEFPDVPCSDPDKPGCPPPSER